MEITSDESCLKNDHIFLNLWVGKEWLTPTEMILGGMNSTPSVSENGAILADETQGWCFRQKGQYGTVWEILIIWDCLKNNMGFTKYREAQHYCLVCICAQVLRCVLWISGSSVWCLDGLLKMKNVFFFFLIKKGFFFLLALGGREDRFQNCTDMRTSILPEFLLWQTMNHLGLLRTLE